ncbi:PP2C family protein-serine/threonine phosphatase [Actinomadura viridis]|uniref:PP2C family protein-serine/threonine phosphatase n=1 Tax=Actinomadura viridis TaxID=58110 RepID=UPI0036882288
MRSALLRDLEHAIWHAKPYELLDTARRVVRRLVDAADAEIYLADYRQSFLVPALGGTESVRIDNTYEGHAYAAQQVVQEEGARPAIHLPLTVHGERIGVLSVRLPEARAESRLESRLDGPEARTDDSDGDPDGAPDGGQASGDALAPGGRDALEAAATVLARALRIADNNTDLYRRIRRRNRLTLAAEMQWDLLPGRACETDVFHLAGQLEPAYAVWGDNFDWTVGKDRLTLTVSNGMGNGTEAAALTHLAVSALRNARRSGADIAEQAALADQTLYAHHRGTRHVATLLLDFELETGRVRAIDAGSPNIYRMRGGVTEELEFEAQLPLGMFGDAHYTTEEFVVEPGDRLVVVSDGVHTAKSSTGELYGTIALLQTLRDTRLQNPSEAVRTFIRQFIAHHQGSDPLDDAVVVCLDWTGKTPVTGDA